jgi:uncharacterized membrane protein SpoIIM required for sporulation
LSRVRRALATAFSTVPPVPRLLWWRRVPILISLIGLPVGAATGWLAAVSHAVPASVAGPALSALVRVAQAPNPPAAAANYFAHNLLAVVLAAILAPLTIGLAGFLLTFLPGFLLGYAAGLSSWALALSGIFPNGLIEIPAAAVAGGLLIHIGASVIHMERRGGWSVRLLRAYAEFALALPWIAAALVVAAVLEAYFA